MGDVMKQEKAEGSIFDIRRFSTHLLKIRVTGSGNNLILKFVGKLCKVGRVACHPDRQAPVLFRIFLSGQQIFLSDYIKLDVGNLQINKGAQELCKFVNSLIRLKKFRQELHV